MSVPDASVIVPVFNAMPYLRACLDSLVTQSKAAHHFEVIAVDDGSTDGGAQVLDIYADAHPHLFTVIHQANSGGPARPCNVGLGRARGRYVFFLGADDHLAPDAIEKMVTHADAWESDVLCPRLVGEYGRFVSQRLFAETDPAVPFPSELLASALSNTKLFRRDLIEKHNIRFPEDLRVGSDQPFTIEALLHARTVSVLADQPYYFAVKRADETNISYSASWRSRITDITAIVRHVAGLLPLGADRDLLLTRHFDSEFSKLLSRDFPDLGESEQEELVSLLRVPVDEFLTPGIRSALKPLALARLVAVERDDLVVLRALAGAEKGGHLLRLDAERLSLKCDALPGDGWLDVTGDAMGRALANAFRDVRLTWCENTLHVDGTADNLEVADGAGRIALTRSTSGRNVSPRLRRASGFSMISGPIQVHQGRLTGQVDASPLLARDAGPWAVRMQVRTGPTGYAFPVRSPQHSTHTLRGAGATAELRLHPDEDGGSLIEVVRRK